ncbi:MAG TPA: hypothetical protein VKV26_15385 [Dehalococcoidia bacterium]|nr:hypothetical protein [Dehalococcoidia bacterium]
MARSWTRHGSGNGGWRDPRLRGRLLGGLAIAAGSIIMLLLYRAYGQPSSNRSELVIRSAPATAPPASTGAVTPLTAPVEAPTAAPPATAAARTMPATAGLLRPGATSTGRLDLSLDGASPGQVAVASRYTVTTGCEPVFADLFALRDGRWGRVWSANDDGAFGPLLPPPQPSASGCYPQLKLFAAQPTANGAAELLLSAAYADGSARFVALGWDQAKDAPAPLFDWRTGPNGRVTRSPDGQRVEIAESVLPPALPLELQFAGDNGRLTQLVSFESGAPAVVSRKLAANCDYGQITPGSVASWQGGAPALLVIDCSSGEHQVVAASAAPALQPAGIGWQDLRDGDTVQIDYTADSLEPPGIEAAVPAAAAIVDYAANTRRTAAQRGAQTNTPRSPAPAAPARQSLPAGGSGNRTQGSSSTRTGTSSGTTSGSTSRSATGSTGSGSTSSTRAQPAATRSAPPAPLVTPPPPPRGLPGAAPPSP